MKIIVSLALLLCSTLLLTGCPSSETASSTDINQSEIHQDYTVRSNQHSTTVSATFRFGGPDGTTLVLIAPSRVQYNRQEMTKTEGWPLGGTFYNYSAQSFQTEHRFEFTDAKGKVYANAINLAPLEWAAAPIRLRRSAANALTFSRALTAGEAAEVTLTDKKGETHTATVSPDAAGVYYDAAKRRLMVTPEFMKTVAPGPATLELKVTKGQGQLTQATHLGGRIAALYEAQTVNVNVGK